MVTEQASQPFNIVSKKNLGSHEIVSIVTKPKCSYMQRPSQRELYLVMMVLSVK